MTIEEAFVELENYIDASDPDLDLVGIVLCAVRVTVHCTIVQPIIRFYLKVISHTLS